MKNFNGTDILESVFDAMPSIIFVVDEDVRIQEYNAAAGKLMSLKKPDAIRRRGGEALNCLYAVDALEGCGRAPHCKGCVIRNSVGEAFQGNRAVRRRAKLEIIRNGNKIEIYVLITASPFRYMERSLVLLVIEDISEIAELRRLIPICSVCKKVRDDKASWSRFEAYFKEHWDVDFSHGICPECYKSEMERLERNSKDHQGSSIGK